MAFSGSILKTSEEIYDFFCTPCAEDNLIKEALKFCVECQQYCCKDCITSHRRIATLKGHSFVDNSSVKPTGQEIPNTQAIPTIQCSQHVGMVMDMFCNNHDVVCCYICATEDHKSCKDVVSVTDNVDNLYNKMDVPKAITELTNILDDMNQWKANTDTILQELKDSKATAIKGVGEHRLEMERLLKKLEEASIKEIEDEYKKLESQILEEKKRLEDFIKELNSLKQLILQASDNVAQMFVCTKLAEKRCTIIGDNEINRGRLKHAEVKFLPSEEMEASLEKMVHLGETSAILTRKSNLCKAMKIYDMDVSIKKDSRNTLVSGMCIVEDTVIFTDYWNNKLKRFDISSYSLIDYCGVPAWPRGVCRVGDQEVAVACENVVQFVSTGHTLSLSHSMKTKHVCYGIAHRNDNLYITDERKSLYMYDMDGKLLKTVTRDNNGLPLFECSSHVTLNDKKDRLFVGDRNKGLVCFDAECDLAYIETIRDTDVRPCGVCVDGYGNVIVANFGLQTIVQCDKDGQKRGTLVHKTRGKPQCVCIHHGLRIMLIGHWSNVVEVYNLAWMKD